MTFKNKNLIKLGTRTFLVAALCVLLSIVMMLPSMVLPTLNGSKAAENVKKTFYPDFTSFEEEQESAAELNERLAAEGFVLLKNRNSKEDSKPTLPLRGTQRRVTALGKGSSNLVLGGSGSGGGGGSDVVTFIDGLEASGFVVNPLVNQLYSNAEQLQFSVSGAFGSFVRESPVSVLDTAKGSFKVYNDAAIVVLSRSGGEGADLPTHNVPGHSDPTEHYLELDDNEKALMKIAKENFDTVIVVVNGANVLEITELATDDEVDAILWMGNPGTNGALAVGRILTGEVNPSGKTADIYVADYTKDPTWYNFGNNNQTHITYEQNADGTFKKDANGNFIGAIEQIDGANVRDWATAFTKDASGNVIATTGTGANANVKTATPSGQTTLTYSEGIYMGYKYYETVADIMDAANNGTGETWYKNNVIYPFGYGLSYTTFTETMSDVDIANDKISFDVTVKNTGAVAGKHVVQIYSNPAVVEGSKIEKATANLVDFKKTPVLAAGEEVVLSFEIALKDLASFDWNDANGNGFKGYELEAGDYIISANTDSHNYTSFKAVTLEAKFFDNSGNIVAKTEGAQDYTELSDGTEYSSYRGASAKLKKSSTATEITGTPMKTLTRYAADSANRVVSLVTDGTATDVAALKVEKSDLAFNAAIVNHSTGTGDAAVRDDFGYDIGTQFVYEMDYEGAEWLKASVDSKWKQGTDSTTKAAIQLYDMSGLSYDDAKWIDFMNQLTYDEMVALDAAGGYQTIANERIGKPRASDLDGPAQLSNGYFWISEVTIACTWNTDLAYEQGIHVGNESILQDVNGWYGPAMNTHRSPFAGRNFEYYSQDGVHGGMIAAQVVKGAVEKGCHVYIKHFMTNDQETYRSGIMTWMTEQAAREIYFKAFQMSVEVGKANGIMTAFNKLGLLPLTHNRIMKNILEDEWGYIGQAVTDFYSTSDAVAWPGNSIIRGSTLPLGTIRGSASGIPSGENIEGVYVTEAVTVNGTAIPANSVVVARNATEAALPAYNEAGELQWSLISPTQWYWVRKTCQDILYTAANGNLMDNGFDTASFADKAVNATQAVALNENLATGLGGTVRTFAVTDGALPAGVTLNGSTGIVSGTPSASGTFTATVTVTVDNYITTDAVITFNVASMFAVKKGTAAIQGIEVKQGEYVDQLYIAVADLDSLGFDTTGATPDTMTYSLATGSNLPAGLDAQNGENGLEIIGTPSQAGTFEFRVRADWVDQNGGSSNRPTTRTYYETYTLTVTETAPVYHTVTLNGNGADNSTITVLSGETVTLPATMARAGHLFTGWYTDAACTTAYVPGAITADTTIYAGWQEIATSDKLAETNNTLSTANTLAVVGLVVGILGVCAGVAGLVMFFLGKKKSN